MSETAKPPPGPTQTPGEVLLQDFLEPAGLSQSALARAIGVSPRRINEIILGKRVITADTDLRLSTYWGMEPGMWLGLQMEQDLALARHKLGQKLALIIPREP
jgi:antitoxin HigA-1